MRVLVTGSSGFLGGAILRACLARGWQAEGLARRDSGGLPARRADLLDADCDPLDPGGGMPFDAVLHAAARVQFHGRSRRVVRDVIADNVAMLRRIVEAAERGGRPRIVFLSSAAVLFRAQDQLELRETSAVPEEFLCAYAEAKYRCERVLEGYRGSWLSLRPAAVVGPGDTTLIPRIVAAAERGRWAWIEGMQRADCSLLSVDNLVACALSALERPELSGVVLLADEQPGKVETRLRHLFTELGLVVPERRISASLALALAQTAEAASDWFARGWEPPLTRLGVETLTRSRVVCCDTMRREFGAWETDLDTTFERVFEALRAGGAR